MKYAVERLNVMPGIAHVHLPSACFIIFADVSALLADNTLAEGDESDEEEDEQDESKRVREPEVVSAAATVVVEGALKAGYARTASPGDGGPEVAAASDTDKKADAEAEEGGGGGTYFAVRAMYRHLFTPPTFPPPRSTSSKAAPPSRTPPATCGGRATSPRRTGSPRTRATSCSSATPATR